MDDMHPARWHPAGWLRRRDRGFAALRRAGRTAIVMPAMFALGVEVVGNADVATFAAFGSFAMLLLVDFSGPIRERLRGQAALAVVGGVFVCIGTLASREAWLAAAAMSVVGFGVIFVGVVSSVLAGATTSLLLAFILPVSLRAPAGAVPDRLAGWAMASGAAIIAVAVLWPAPASSPLRGPAAAACRALAARLRSDVAVRLAGPDAPGAGPHDQRDQHDQAVARAAGAVGELQRIFLATPYRPTGLSTAARTIVRLVDELSWLNAVVAQSATYPAGGAVSRPACAVVSAAAAVLDQGADLLESAGEGPAALRTALAGLQEALAGLERGATAELPVRRMPAASPPADLADASTVALDERISEFVTSLEPSFRAQELSFAVTAIARNIELAGAAEQRGWLARVLGRRPAGLTGTLSAAQERAAAHVERHSVWLHNSVRGAAGLGLAVLVANITGVQHAFWVVLGTLSVLRSNALSTGQNVVRGILGTVAGFLVGAALLALIGTNTTVLWILLPVAILLAGVAPAAVSFAAGQGAFTLALVILYNIIAPAGWRVGLVRVEDITLGCAVSLVVGLLFWPRGAGMALGRALAEAYAEAARYLAGAVMFGMLRCDTSMPPATAPTADAVRAAAASRRLDDAFRGYLAERGAKPVPLADVTSLVTGVVGLRLAADAVGDLWQRDDGQAAGHRAAARREVLAASGLVRNWYDELAASLTDGAAVREPLPHDKAADGRLVDAVRRDLGGPDGRASATAVRMIWTADHVDAARRLQATLVDPARTAAERRTFTTFMTPWR
jgi:Fusaric acid resistance protein-like